MTRTRKPHLLTASKEIVRPQNIIFFDTESHQNQPDNLTIRHTLRLGSSLFVRLNYKSHKHSVKPVDFFHNLDFWNEVDRFCRPKTITYLVAHNIIFDLAVSNGFTHLYNLGFTLDSFYTKGMVSIFRWSKGDIKIVGLDNGNLFNGKLEKWGKIFGYPKMSVDFDTVTDDELLPYCRRDVEIMYRSWMSWLKFLDDHNCGSFKVTVGSTAFNTWLHRFQKSKVFIHTNPLATTLERESYKGGRTECLFQGRIENGSFYYLDINNMYGYVLSRYLYPSSLWDAKECDSLSMLIRKLEKYAVIAKVIVNVTQPYYPHKHDGFTCYPIGRFETTLTTPELILGFQNGWIEAVSHIAWYKQTGLFSEYVKEFYTLRQQYKKSGNEGYEKICKLLVNSLYGKFGQQGFEQKRIGDASPDTYYSESVFDIDKRDFYRHIALAGGIYEERKTGESYNAFTAIASHVTAYARLLLSRLYLAVPTHCVYYMDTDSLIVNEIGKKYLEPMMSETELGMLKVELHSDFIEINAPKDYKMAGRSKIKGVSSSAIENADGSYTQLQWERLSSMIRRKSTDGFQSRYVTKHNQRRITSGVVGSDGWVHPFVLGSEPVEPAHSLFLVPDLQERLS